MRKKCKACGAPLQIEKCDYCGTVRKSKINKHPTTDDLANSQIEELSLLDSVEQTDQQLEEPQLEDNTIASPDSIIEMDPSPIESQANDDIALLDSLEQAEIPPVDSPEDSEANFLSSLEQTEPTSDFSQPDDSETTLLDSLEQTESSPDVSQIEDSETALLSTLEQTEPQPLSDEPQEMMMQPKRTAPIIIAIILIILLFFGAGWFIFNMLTSNVDAFELLEKSFITMEDVDSFSADVDLEMQVISSITSIDTPINIRMYVEMLDDDNYNMQMDISTEVLGMEDVTTIYWRDGYAYTVQNDIVTRERTNEDDQIDSDPSMFGMMNMDFFQEFATSATAERTTGGYHLEFIIDEDAMMELLLGDDITNIIDGQDDSDMLDMFDMLEMLGMLEDMFEFEEASLDIYLNSDYMITSASFDTSIEFTLEGFDGSMEIHGDLVIDQIGNVTVDFPAYLDDAVEIVNMPIEESPLLGYWENGEGLVFLWVFGRADSVEFLEDGTAIITENGVSDTVSWSPGITGAFTADERPFTYVIDGNILTIVDSSNDVWSFVRSGEDSGNAIINFDDDEDDDNGDDEADNDEDDDSDDENDDEDDDNGDEEDNDNNDEDLATDIIGTWEWDNNDDFTYTFNDDGTAVRGFSDSPTNIEWEITDDNIIILHIGARTEEWEAVIEGNMLTITNLENNNEWNYFRID